MKFTSEDFESVYKKIAAWCEQNDRVVYTGNGGLVCVDVNGYACPDITLAKRLIPGRIMPLSGVLVDLSTIAPEYYAAAIAQAVFEAGCKQGANAVRDAISQALTKE